MSISRWHGTLIEAWASHESFRPNDGDEGGNGINFHRQKRNNDTQASTTEPDWRLNCKVYELKAKGGRWS